MVKEETKLLESLSENTNKYVDVELSYKCKDQEDIDRVLKTVNAFIKNNGEGLQRININILGYVPY